MIYRYDKVVLIKCPSPVGKRLGNSMKFKSSKLLTLLILLTGTIVQAQNASLNNLPLDALHDQPQYNFWVAGHVRGSDHRANRSIYPASSFLANLDLFNSSSARFVMLLGESFNHITPLHADAMRQSLGSLHMPVFNTLGKQEHAQRQDYARLFGHPNHQQFMIGPDVYLMVDSFAPNWAWLTDRLTTISQTPAMRHVFIFASRMPWGANEQLPSLPTKQPASHSITLPSQKTFNEQVTPLLTKLAQIKSVYWFAGNIDSSHINSCYYWQDNNSELTVIATGLTDSAKDVMVNVQISELGVVRVTPVSLVNSTITAMSQYTDSTWNADIKQWQKKHPKQIFTRYFKHKTKEVLLSKKFAAGIFGGLVFGIFLMMSHRPTRPNRPFSTQTNAMPQTQNHLTSNPSQQDQSSPIKRAA